MNGILKKIAYTSLIQDLIVLLFAVILLNMQGFIFDIIAIFIGAFFIFKGIVDICRYAISKGLSDLYKNELVFGLISILLGFLIIIARNAFGWLINTCIAIFIIYGAVKNLDFSMKMKSLGINMWLAMAVISVLMIIFGIYILLNKNILVSAYAIYLIIYSIMDIVESILFILCSRKIFK